MFGSPWLNQKEIREQNYLQVKHPFGIQQRCHKSSLLQHSWNFQQSAEIVPSAHFLTSCYFQKWDEILHAQWLLLKFENEKLNKIRHFLFISIQIMWNWQTGGTCSAVRAAGSSRGQFNVLLLCFKACAGIKDRETQLSWGFERNYNNELKHKTQTCEIL